MATDEVTATPSTLMQNERMNRPVAVVAVNLTWGRYIRGEGVYSGACNGDSGGPLFVKGASLPRAVVGVVSYGAVGCNERAPTVFSRVSYYLPTIASGRKYLSARAAEPLAPLALTAEKVTGSYRPQVKLTAT
ncbi:MAG: trypsin-like serine protease, partial [Actinomycetota bacterium]